MKAAVYDVINTVTQDEMDAGRLQKVFDIAVEINDDIQLPAAFDEPVRVDLIRRAVQAARNNRRQAYGSRAHGGKKRPMAGMKHSVEWWGKGRGVARIMRRTGSRPWRPEPSHPRGPTSPRSEGGEGLVEQAQSRRAPIGDAQRPRGHDITGSDRRGEVTASQRRSRRSRSCWGPTPRWARMGPPRPSSMHSPRTRHKEAQEHPREPRSGCGPPASKEGRKIRAGKGTMRGRVHKQPKSALIVVASKDGLARAENLPGVDVVAARDLSAEDLAPGGDLGRLTVFTSAAIETLGGSA